MITYIGIEVRLSYIELETIAELRLHIYCIMSHSSLSQ
jgi:hypothetical protein